LASYHSKAGRASADSLTPEQRRLRAQIAAFTKHSQYDAKQSTVPARAVWLASFDHKVDPEGVLPLPERRRRAEAALRAHMLKLALASAKARKRAAQ
jgi:hypothetical protein